MNVVADTLSRDPLPITKADQLAAAVDLKPDWSDVMKRKVEADPEKYPEYKVLDTKLYRRFSIRDPLTSPQDIEWKLCPPVSDRERIMRENHDAVTAGHLGIAKTISRMTKHFYWPGMFRDVHKYVRKCDSCNRHKALQQKPSGLMYSSATSRPWEVVCADFVGPLPCSLKGNTMLLVMVDKFSKWVEVAPMRKATTAALIRAVRERLIPHFGVPEVFLSDNGAQFVSNKFKEFLGDYKIRHHLTAPYTPQENPTERVNKVLKTMISQYTQENQRLWDEFLPELSLAINTSRHDSTGYSPALLNFGRELRVPTDFQRTIAESSPEPIEAKSERMKALYELVQINLEKATQTQARAYNLRRRPWRPSIGEQVYKKLRVLSSGANYFTEKLAPRYDGPYEVLKFVSPVIVILRKKGETKNTASIRAHVRDLKSVYSEETERENTAKHNLNFFSTPGLSQQHMVKDNYHPNRLISQSQASKPYASMEGDQKRKRGLHRLAPLERPVEDPCTRVATRPRKVPTTSTKVPLEFKMKSGKRISRIRAEEHDRTAALPPKPKESADQEMKKIRNQLEAANKLKEQSKRGTENSSTASDRAESSGCSIPVLISGPKLPSEIADQFHYVAIPKNDAVFNTVVAMSGPVQAATTTNRNETAQPGPSHAAITRTINPPTKITMQQTIQPRMPSSVGRSVTPGFDPFEGIHLVGQYKRAFQIFRPWGAISVLMNRNGTRASMKFGNMRKTVHVQKK